MPKIKWKNHGRYQISEKPVLPGVFLCKQGGFFVRARATNPKHGKQESIEKRLDVPTEYDALLWLEERRRRVRAGNRAEKPERTRFSEYAASLLERKVAVGELNSPKTVVTWGTTLEKHLIPAFGDLFMDAITRADIEAWKFEVARKIKAKEYSPNTANVWFRTLRVILNAATPEFELPRNPIGGVKPFSTRGHRTYTHEEPNSLRPEDVPTFMGEMLRLYPQHYAMTSLGFATGLRPSSLRPLRRKGDQADLLWDEGILLVRRSQTIGEAVETTKTDRDQWLYLPQTLWEVFDWHIQHLSKAPMIESDLLFPSFKGGYRSNTVLEKPFKRVAKSIGLTYSVSPKAMRRTFQDLARAARVGDLVQRAISGHATEAMQHHYSTVGETEMRTGLAKVIELADIRGALRALEAG